MSSIYCHAQENNKRSQEILGLKLYTGRIDIYEAGRFLYCLYSQITRLTQADAVADAELLKAGIQ